MRSDRIIGSLRRQRRLLGPVADGCGATALADAYAAAGYPVSRAPLDFQGEAMERLGAFADLCRDLKRTLDPVGILAPGRYGID